MIKPGDIVQLITDTSQNMTVEEVNPIIGPVELVKVVWFDDQNLFHRATYDVSLVIEVTPS